MTRLAAPLPSIVSIALLGALAGCAQQASPPPPKPMPAAVEAKPAPAEAKPAAAVPKPAAATPADEKHDHADHEHPQTLAAGVAELETVLESLGKHLAADAKDDADDAVHAVGHLLEDLEGLVAKGSLEADAKAAASKAIAELYECFDKLDVAFHAAEGESEPPAKVHASLAERIAAAVKSLKEAL